MSDTKASKKASRVLIIRPSALGDVSRTVPLLVSLRHAMPDAHIDWLVHEAFADVIRHHPALDGLVLFPRNRFARICRNPRVMGEAFAWLRDLRRRKYDLVIDAQGLFRSGLFSHLTTAPTRIGFKNAREFAWLGYNRRHHVDEQLHTVDRLLALIEAAGIKPKCDMRLYVGETERQWLDQYLTDHHITDNGYACLAPFAQWRSKCWPIACYGEIAHRLLKTGLAGQHLILVSSPREQDQLQPMLDALYRRNPNLRNHILTPKTSVGQMMALLDRTTMLVSNDSAPLHIAVGFARPIVGIYGPTDSSLVGPYQRESSVVRPALINNHSYNYRRSRDDQSLIAQITTDEVWRKIKQQL